MAKSCKLSLSKSHFTESIIFQFLGTKELIFAPEFGISGKLSLNDKQYPEDERNNKEANNVFFNGLILLSHKPS